MHFLGSKCYSRFQREKHVNQAPVLKVLTIFWGESPREWPLSSLFFLLAFALHRVGENPSVEGSSILGIKDGSEFYFSQFGLHSKEKS